MTQKRRGRWVFLENVTSWLEISFVGLFLYFNKSVLVTELDSLRSIKLSQSRQENYHDVYSFLTRSKRKEILVILCKSSNKGCSAYSKLELFNAALIRERRLFEKCAYSGKVIIRGRPLFKTRIFLAQRLYKRIMFNSFIYFFYKNIYGHVFFGWSSFEEL